MLLHEDTLCTVAMPLLVCLSHRNYVTQNGIHGVHMPPPDLAINVSSLGMLPAVLQYSQTNQD